jgi:hypothetical protein
LPKGRIFPLSRDELIECAALLRCVNRGELDRLTIPKNRWMCSRSKWSPPLPQKIGMRMNSSTSSVQPGHTGI